MLRLRRTVEMYQWVETTSSRTENNLGGSKTTETTYNYKKQWSESPENSGNFHDQSGHENPQMPVRSTTIDSQRVRLGAYQVDRAVLQQVAAFAPLDPPHDAAFPAGYRADGDMIYRGGNSASPAIGDLRIHYAAVASQMMSVVAAQSGDTLAVFHAANGYQIALAAPGVMPAAAMFQEKKQEEATLTWILRGAGFVAMLIGFMLIANPLAVLASVLPFLGDLVGAGTFLMSLAVSVPVTLVVIAAAWIANRPLIGGGLIVAAIAFLVLLPKLRGVKARAA